VWNKQEEKEYGGREWRVGDVVGCLLSFPPTTTPTSSSGTIRYYLNGDDLGVAFDNVVVEGIKGYYPAISLEEGEVVRVNIGGAPFRFLPPTTQQGKNQPPKVRWTRRRRNNSDSSSNSNG